MKNWIVFYQPHTDQVPRILTTRSISDYLGNDDDVKTGDLAYVLCGGYGLYGWGYFIKVNRQNIDENNKMYVDISLRIFQPNLVSIEEVNQTPELFDIYREHNRNIVELYPREFNTLNKLLRLKGIEPPEDISEFQERIGKFGVKDTSSLSQKLQQVIENYNLASLLFLDLDNFKSVNDNYNHSVGDQVIREALEEVQTVIDGKGELFHRCGDEMIVLLPNLNNADSMVVAENIRLGIENKKFSTIGQGFVTTTIGVSTYPDTSNDWKNLEKQADEIAMKTKKVKKNSVSNS